ncbi:hypothetical protein HPB49_014627 [Dermacentor silvarum]|uniref:Uncharacterized protein n=1 Tax=Dermacentor silvarum TaxID=543639 RepID=A0ACB8C458_DERSI|nr:hypothetical protein HPB49_014627 [Dermacentor silvarum]
MLIRDFTSVPGDVEPTRFDEIGRYDIAAVIDLVLNATGSTRVSLLGYSQGVFSSLVLLSTRPEYNDKLLLDPLGNSGYFHLPQVLRKVIQAVCNIFKGQPCSLFLTLTLISSAEQSNKIYRSNNFLMYDYGSSKNKDLYGQKKPPAYPMERITVPVALFSSEGDTLGNPEDVSSLAESLGSELLFSNVVPPKFFRHMDFAFGYKATDFLHGPMIDTLDRNAGTSV